MRIILCFILLIQSIPGWTRVDSSLNARITHFEELQRKVQTECLNNPNSTSYRLTVGTQNLNCPDLIAIVNRLKAGIEKDVDELEASCEQPTVPAAADQLAQDSIRIARAAGLCPVKSRDSQCMGQIACAAISVANPLAGLLAQASTLAGVKNECANTGASCMQAVFKGIIDSLWSTISSIWDLAKAGVVKLGQALGLVKRNETATSERGLAAQQTAPSFIQQFKRNPGATLRTLANNIFQGLKTAAMNSYGCEKWSGAPYISNCVTPMTNWDCASCQQKISVFCGIGGIAVGEIVTAFFTGGLAAGAKFVATGALRAVKGIQQGRKVTQASATALRAAQAVFRTIPKSAEGLALASRTALRATQGAARALTVTERRAVTAWNAVKTSRTSRALSSAATTAGNSRVVAGGRIALKPVTAYLNAIDNAARAGFSTVDNALASSVTRTDRVVDATEVVTDGTTLANSADNIPVQVPSPEMVRMGSLSDTDRLTEATTLLNRPLTEAQQAAVLEAHRIGEGTGRGFFTYTADEIREKGLRLREAGFSAPEIRLLMERGVTGSVASGKTAGDLFSDARSSLVRATDERTKYERLLKDKSPNLETSITTYQNLQRQGAEGYLAEGIRTSSPSLVGESWRAYTRAGDGPAALRTVQSALTQFPGMKADALLVEFRARVDKINNTLRQFPDDPLLKQEKAALTQVIDGLKPPTVAVVRPPVAPVTQTPVTPVVTPVTPVTPAVPTFRPPPANARASEVRNVANEYRLGRGGKPRDPEVASQYYYHIAREAMNKEAAALKSGSRRSSQYLDDNDTSTAFTESISGNGTVARQMLEDLKTKRGSSGVNEFINEIHERGMYSNKDPAVKKKFTEFINHIDETYRKNGVLFGPQEGMIRNWRSYNHVDP